MSTDPQLRTDPRDLSEILDEMAEAHLRQAAQSERDKWKDLRRAALECVFWCWVGIACIGWALHSTDIAYGKAAFYAGIAIGNGGVIFTLLAAYRRGEERGDW
jgi:hypothetical protein